MIKKKKTHKKSSEAPCHFFSPLLRLGKVGGQLIFKNLVEIFEE